MLTYQLNPAKSESLYVQLYRFIRHDIAHGTIAPDERLPSRRALAAHLGVGAITVEAAYRQLVAEGYVRAEERRGYFANRLAPAMWARREGSETPGATRQTVDGTVDGTQRAVGDTTGGARRAGSDAEGAAAWAGSCAHVGNARPETADVPPHELLADFRAGSAATQLFPYGTWARVMRETLAEESAASLADAARAPGSLRLRTAIAAHLRESRGMTAGSAHIVVGAGAQTLYQLVIQLLGRSRTIAVEDPGYPRLAQIYRANDVALAPVALDAEGIAMDGLRASGASVAHLMPSHQFPTGIVTSAARRRDLLNWAREPYTIPTSDDAAESQRVGALEAAPGTPCDIAGRYLIEDDYDSDFRLAGHPIPPLFSIDAAERVIYLGSFANTLGAAFRFGYLVLPAPLSAAFAQRLGFYSNTVSPIDQLALARFIEHGHYERHVNRLRAHVRATQNELVRALRTSSIGDRLTFRGLDGGLHFALEIASADEAQLTRNAWRKGIALAPLSQYRIAKRTANATAAARPHPASFVMNYSAIDRARIPEIVAALARATTA